MAREIRRTTAPLIERLLREPYRFEFFQAVRLIERCSPGHRGDGRTRVGAAASGRRLLSERVRFRAVRRSSFPAGEIVSLGWAPLDARSGKPSTTPASEETRSGEHSDRLEMLVSFLGLTGPAGVLPQHYTRLVLELLRERDEALADFLDLFHHRLVSLFYGAWAKYRVFVGFDKAQDHDRGFTGAVRSIAGLRTTRAPKSDGAAAAIRAALLYYAGLAADGRRPSATLGLLASEYFGVPIEIESFRGQWLALDPADWTRLDSAARFAEDAPNVLGATAVLGGRVWDTQSRFRVRVGPVRHADFLRFSPPSLTFTELCHLVRAYAGAELDFDVQVILEAGEERGCRLEAKTDSAGHRLGRNAWLAVTPAAAAFDRAVFEAEL